MYQLYSKPIIHNVFDRPLTVGTVNNNLMKRKITGNDMVAILPFLPPLSLLLPLTSLKLLLQKRKTGKHTNKHAAMHTFKHTDKRLPRLLARLTHHHTKQLRQLVMD